MYLVEVWPNMFWQTKKKNYAAIVEVYVILDCVKRRQDHKKRIALSSYLMQCLHTKGLSNGVKTTHSTQHLHEQPRRNKGRQKEQQVQEVYATIISQSFTPYTLKSYCLSLCLSVANRFTLCTYSCSSVVMIVIHIMQIVMCLQRASKSSISVTCCWSFTNHFEVVKREQQHSKQDSKANYTCNSSIQSDIPIHQSTNCHSGAGWWQIPAINHKSFLHVTKPASSNAHSNCNAITHITFYSHVSADYYSQDCVFVTRKNGKKHPIQVS